MLGCPAFPDGTPRGPLQRRLECALRAAARFPEAVLVLSGGAVLGPVEADVMARWLVDAGVAPHRLRKEPLALDTAENARYGVAIAAELGAKRLTVVTERFHAARAVGWVRLAARRSGLSLRIDVEAAPDGLGALARIGRAVSERLKWWSGRARA